MDSQHVKLYIYLLNLHLRITFWLGFTTRQIVHLLVRSTFEISFWWFMLFNTVLIVYILTIKYRYVYFEYYSNCLQKTYTLIISGFCYNLFTLIFNKAVCNYLYDKHVCYIWTTSSTLYKTDHVLTSQLWWFLSSVRSQLVSVLPAPTICTHF